MAKKKRGGRWYDRYPKLADYLDKMQALTGSRRNTVIRGLRDLLVTRAPGLIDRTVTRYPLTYKRRWYDADPLCWLTINGISYAEPAVIVAATGYLKTALAVKPRKKTAGRR